ncbi:MAG TPA: hypothetical protein VGE74_26035 [Gemmata sp.]
MANKSGKSGYVAVGDVPFAFGKWKLAMKAGTPKTTNFLSGGFQTVVPGVIEGTITLSGPWDVGNMPIGVNGVYPFHLGLDTGVELVVTAQVSGIDADNDVEGTPSVSVTATTTGSFSAAIT